ncbi:transporter associated domain-containing protein [Thermodesulfobacterium hydrogeniphilum]|uniref:transporter associated domain-containing protein n=1 Tax=Thermodesulfobacterium hydrogeniphilum TaxID=161156 RepID=UPI00056E292C|nr:transporter associated domain-containing protein [Thermodesulfobacterium hydrogeniphilum]
MENDSFFDILKFLFKRKTSELAEVEEEIKELLEDYKEEKVVTDFEEKLILNFLNLKNLEVREFVIPRNELIGLDLSFDWEEVQMLISQSPHYFYPVYKNILDNLVGFISLKDLARGMGISIFNWTEWVKEPLIIPENISVISAFEKMVDRKTEVAFVVDEHSELTGMLCLKDILKEILKKEVTCPHPDAEGWIVLPGTFKIRELERCLNIELPKGEYETVSGLIIEHTKKIPKVGEKIKIPPLEIEILKSNQRKIDLIRLKIVENKEK